MPKVLVLFYSRTGRTAALADAIAEGAGSVKFTEVEIRRIDDLAPTAGIEDDESRKVARASLVKKYRTLESVESLTRYDGLIIGSPARSGIISAELKHTLDEVGALAERGALVDKVGSAFGSAAAGGDEMSIMSMLIPMMHFGMIIVPAGQGGPSAIVGGDPAAARLQGARVAKVAEWVRHAKSHEAHGHRH
jgi:NAD(P)H dehydrogenase (quinone)